MPTLRRGVTPLAPVTELLSERPGLDELDSDGRGPILTDESLPEARMAN